MNSFLKILPILLLSNFSLSQVDSIFTKNNDTIICTITIETYNSIEYKTKSADKKWIDLFSVKYYSKNGIRFKGGAKPKVTKISRIDSVDISAELLHFRTCMTKFYSQYSAGLGVTLVGGSMTGVSLFIDDVAAQRGLGIGGVVVMLAGFLTAADAHKWLMRAGLGVSGNGNTVEIRYRFK